jgi:hypothetical protein
MTPAQAVMPAAPARPPAERLTELDWLRIIAFGLLIAYHAGMVYVSWGFHVKSPRLVPALEPWMTLLNPWRMSLLFVVSGAATGLMIERGRGLARSRSRRLLLPLLFGVAVVVPPQAYVEVVQKLHYTGSYLDFLKLYFSRYRGFCPDGLCLELPTWNHLWFLPYLWVYTMLLAAALATLGPRWRLSPSWGWLGQRARLLWVPVLLFALLRQYLSARFPSTHDLLHDPYNHALYGSMFALGVVLWGHRDDPHGAWAAAVRLRWWAVGAALAAHGVQQVAGGWMDAQGKQAPFDPEVMWAALRALTGVKQWAPIVAALGFAHRHLAGRDNTARRWLTEAVFPAYMVHQTVIVLAAPSLARQGWPLGWEMLALLACTALACAVLYLAVRRVPLLAAAMGVERRGGRGALA